MNLQDVSSFFIAIWKHLNFISKIENKSDTVIDVYLGNDLIDEQIIKANNRRTVRSGGRA